MRLPAVIAVFGISCCCSCTVPADPDDPVIHSLQDGLMASTQTIALNNERLLESLRDKVSEPRYSSRAEYWKPKAQQLHAQAQRLQAFLEHARKSAAEDKDGTDHSTLQRLRAALHHRLNGFMDSVAQLDSAHTSFLADCTRLLRVWDPAKPDPLQQMEDHLFSDQQLMQQSGWIDLQNRLARAEQQLLSYFHDQVQGGCNLDYRQYSAIIAQSSTVVRPGEELEITAGMGAFESDGKPKVVIGGREVPLGPEQTARFRFTAARKPGRYVLPAVVEFND
ncbi:MAG TPA: hypothetical protein VHK69_17675, partial [Chitinophagaceae bacterium]|nr:hypothetical protein [Chitinophagaceae bacterium]